MSLLTLRRRREWGLEVKNKIMSKFFEHNKRVIQFCGKRIDKNENELKNNFANDTLFYLDEQIINHLLDSIEVDRIFLERRYGFHDYSFITAPAYKALEGFLLQIAKDLKLPSAGNSNFAGSYYFDEGKIDKHVDKLIKELEQSTEKSTKLSKYEKQDIKDKVKEMKSFLRHYRHSPAHYFGEPVEKLEKAHRNIMIIYGAVDNTAKILLKAKLIEIVEDIH